MKQIMVLVALLIGSTTFAFDTGTHGGGSHVCKNNMEFYDLYEGRKNGLVIEELRGSVEQILNNIVQKVRSYKKRLAQHLESRIDYVQETMLLVEDLLPRVVDANIEKLEPGCRYEQLAVWYDIGVAPWYDPNNPIDQNQYPNGQVHIQKQLWNSSSMTNMQKAALIVHEALYDLFRDNIDESTSDNIRLTVATLFSEEDSLGPWLDMLIQQDEYPFLYE